MKRGGYLTRRTPLSRGTSRLRKGRGFRRYSGQAEFREAVLHPRPMVTVPCLVCEYLWPEHAHHVLYKQTLSRYGYGDRADDPRNGVPTCATCHEDHHNGSKPIPYSLLPQAAIDFATELGLEWKLRRNYPSNEEGTQ